MQSTIKLLGVFITLAVIFGVTGCPTEPGGDDVKNPAYLGETPTLSGTVGIYTVNQQTGAVIFPAYSGNELTVSHPNLYETGKIESGQFSLTLGAPIILVPFTVSTLENFYLFEDYPALRLDSDNVRGDIITYFDIDDSPDYWGLFREYEKRSFESTYATSTYEMVFYIYVTKDVTLRAGDGELRVPSGVVGDVYYYTTHLGFVLPLRAGWNAVHSNTYTIVNERSEGGWIRHSYIKLSLQNPDLRWVLQEESGNNGDNSSSDRSMSRMSKTANFIESGVVE
jgi:hypothetical protein